MIKIPIMDLKKIPPIDIVFEEDSPSSQKQLLKTGFEVLKVFKLNTD
jgi:hypothetical protein